MQPVKLVMFDYDGVIVDSLQVFSQSYIAACRENGLQAIATEQDVLALFEHNVYESLRQRGVAAATIDKILASYELRQNARLRELKLFDGMAQALQTISRENKVFIITSNLSAATETVLRAHNVNCVTEVIGADKEKSKIAKIKKIMSGFKDLPAFYVGDTKGDMIEGRAAGAYTVGVAWGWHSTEQLQAGNAGYLVHTPQELVSLLLRPGLGG